MIKSAVLLAAGRGKRQRPYTDVTPKPLLEVHGRATLDYVLCAVAKAGVERVCIVTNHLEEKIIEYVGDGSKWNLEVFGQLMNESCESSIMNYESGSDILIELHELVSGMDSVYGSRFSGGGYGGCVVALVQRAAAENICARVAEAFKAHHPDLPSKAFIAETGDGLR